MAWKAVVVDDWQAIGETLLTVRAIDRDGDEVRYRMAGDGNAPQFFRVDEISGEISTRQDLRLDSRLTYTVSLVYDNRREVCVYISWHLLTWQPNLRISCCFNNMECP